MSSTIITKNSSTASAVPLAGDLVKGELAINVTDKKLYTKDNSAAVVKVVGSLGNQEANAVAITGGSIAGITDLAVADGGTGASTAANARTNLGAAASGANSDITSLSGLTTALSVAQGGTGVTTSTGTGSVVLSNSPTLVTPALGTPSAAVLTNATGLPLTTGVTGTLPVANGGTGITSLGSGVATFLGTPSSANLAAAVTDETGTGALVFANSPTLVTPALGTPSSATLTNATGLPVSTGISGLGTGVATFLATPSSANLASAVSDETGTGALVFANSPTLVTPALGTPASGVLTNTTGLPLTTGVTGTLPVANGGTGVTTATGTGSVVLSNSPTLVTPALGTPSALVGTNITGTAANFNINGTVGATTPASGSFTTLTTSSTVTHNAGTANGVAYLNGSKALTTGSALTFDGTSLVAGASAGAGQSVLRTYTAGGYAALYNGAVTPSASNFVLAHNALQTYLNGNDFIGFSQAGSEQMRLTSTGLGIGTSSPSEKLVVSGGCLQVTGNLQSLNRPSSSVMDFLSGATRFFSIGANSSTYGSFSFRNATTTTNTEVMAIDSAGNLGLGVTPSASTRGKGFDIGLTGGLYGDGITVNFSTHLTNNAYPLANGNWVYKNSSQVAQRYSMESSGQHQWFTAPSGTAGNAISFTQAMTLNASGNLLVGTTSAGNGSRIYIRGPGTTSATASFEAANSAGATLLFVQDDGTTRFFGSAGTETARITSGGDLLVGTTSSGGKLTVSAANGTTPMVLSANTTSGNAAGYASSLQTAANNTSSYHYYGSTLAVGNWYLYGNGTSSWSSDERLKKNITTARDGYLEDLCQLRVVKYQWKNGTDQVELGLIAQEVEKVFPGLVQDDLNPLSPDDPTLYKQLKGSVLPFIMLKAIQELKAEFDAYKASHP